MAVRKRSLDGWMLLAAVGAAGAGAAVGLIGAAGQGSAHLDEGHDQGRYTHGSSNCSVESRKDPINVVLVGSAASWDMVQAHAASPDHGGWDDDSGSEQYFIDHFGVCQPKDGQSASAGGFPPPTRYHMRYNQGDINGVPDFDTSIPLSDGSTTAGYYTLTAVHYEEGGLTVCRTPVPGLPDIHYPGHAVYSNLLDPPGGYEMGRQELANRWLSAGDGHRLIDVQNWENWEIMLQCNGQYAWSSGLVDYIGMPCAGVDPTVWFCDPETSRVSVDSAGQQGNGSSRQFVSAVSDDGRFVAFYSFADNLVPDDNNGTWDAFVHDRATEVTERVSVSSSGEEGDRSSFWHLSISADGRYVAFVSEATNLVPGDNNNTGDIFVRDRQAGVTERVSVDSGGVESVVSYAEFPAISADGRYVAFTSWADDLVSGDMNETVDVFVHDRQTGTTERVSVSGTGEEGNSYSGDISQISISADGRFVAFVSHASNLVPDDNNDEYDVFVHDRQTGETERVSVSSAGAESNDEEWWPSISDDGRYVAFQSSSSNLVPGDTNTCRPQHDPGNCGDVFVHDRQTGATERVSVSSSGEEATDESEYAYISGSGRFVAFSSEANNLVSGDSNGNIDVFVHDRETGLTQRVSVSSTGSEAEGQNRWTAINYDGTVVVFVSWATNLVADDTNGVGDVFVRSSTTDTDGDGLPDSIDLDDDNDSLGLGDFFGLFFRDEVEAFMSRPEDPDGTDPLDSCADTSTTDDEDDDKWGPDFDDSQDVDGSDVFLLAQRFGTEKDVPPPVGKLPYLERFDIYPTAASLHKIDGSDVFVYAKYSGLSC